MLKESIHGTYHWVIVLLFQEVVAHRLVLRNTSKLFLVCLEEGLDERQVLFQHVDV